MNCRKRALPSVSFSRSLTKHRGNSMKNTLQFLQNSSRSVRMITLALLALSLAVCAQAQTFTSLYSFCTKTNCADGDGVTAPLVQGTDGNLYGETAFGGRIGNSYFGSIGWGTIFKVTTRGKLTTIYTFCLSSSTCTDGSGPSRGLVLVTDRNFYCVTTGGADQHPRAVL